MPVVINGTTGIVSPKVNALDLELDSKNVVERGSNANGEYVRFADGTQICTRIVSGYTTSPDAGLSILYPASFLEFPIVQIRPWTTGDNDFASRTRIGVFRSDFPDSLSAWIFRVHTVDTGARVANATETGVISLLAVGRWY